MDRPDVAPAEADSQPDDAARSARSDDSESTGDDEYTRESADGRLQTVREATGASLAQIGAYSVDPAEVRGNIENFAGVAQLPLGIAGPLLVNGEHAQGEFQVPMATTEGTLVASYNRGMKLAREAGGVTATVLDDAMQRAPAFGFDSARQAREFGDWVRERFDDIREQAESATRSGHLRDIEQYSASRLRFLRFNFTSGDAAGQNLSGRATAPPANGFSGSTQASVTSSSRPTSRPTRRLRRSTSCTPEASEWWARSRFPTSSWSAI